jgi:hypothetical protein
MTSIDFRQKLHDARNEVFPGDRLNLTDVLEDLDKLFLDLCDAASDQRCGNIGWSR